MNRPVDLALIRRMHRHSNLLASRPATISTHPAFPASTKAHLLPPGSDLPMGTIIGIPPYLPPQNFFAEPSAWIPVQNTQPPISSHGVAIEPRRQQNSIPPPRPTPRSIPPQAPARPLQPSLTQLIPPQSPQDQPSAIDEPTWSRLQTIFNRHQDQPTSATASPAPIQIQRAERVERVEQVQRTQRVERAPENQISRESISSSEEISDSVVKPIAHQPLPANLKSPAAVQQSPIPSPAPHQRVSQVLPNFPLNNSNETHHRGEDFSSNHNTAAQFQSTNPTPQTKNQTDSAEEIPTQPFPLEAIWPVQRAPENNPSEVMQSQPGQPPVDDFPPAHITEETRVRSILQGIAPGQPTGSRIEVIHPRVPRPINPNDAVKSSVPEQEPRLNPVPSSQPIRDSNPISRPPEQNVHPYQIQPSQDIDDQLYPTRREHEIDLQKFPDQIPPVQRSQEEITPEVDTAVGTLPRDLWTLIGEDPPTHHPGVQTANHAPSPKSAQIQRPFDSQSSPKVVIQRQSEQQETTSVSAPEQSSAAEQTENTPDPESPSQSVEPPAQTSGGGRPAVGQIDTDELARRVYAQLRRRLAVEWERLRQRF